jgi:dynactin 1
LVWLLGRGGGLGFPRGGRPWGVMPFTALYGSGGGGSEGKRPVAAKLQIRLPGGVRGKRVGGEVQIVGSREWEGLQGRFAVV